MRSKVTKPRSRAGENIKGDAQQTPGQGGSVGTGEGGQTVQDLGGVHRVVTGSGGKEGSGLLPAGGASATEGGKPPEGYESWDKFREAVDAGTYKPKAADPNAAAPGTDGKDKAADQTKNAGLPALSDPATQAKLAPFSEEFSKTGTLTAESKAKAAKEFGVPVEMVDLYLAGAAATQTAAQQPFYTEFGSQETYGQFQEWAAQNLSDAEKQAFNDALDKAPQAALVMAKSFKGRWQSNGGGEGPRDITRQATGGSANGDQYGSWAEVTADMGKPEYAKDPAFRAKVEAKLGRSNPKS